MPEGVRYLSQSLPPHETTGDVREELKLLREECSERFRTMYVEEGAGDSDTAVSGSSLTFSMIHIILTTNIIATEAYFVGQGFPEASGSGILFIAFEQDEDGGHLITWDATEFHGAGTFDTEQWHVDTRPSRVTVFQFVRNPREGEGNKWWLVSALSSYDAPERTP